MATEAKFQVGQTYSCRSFGDYDCIYSFQVIRRTDKTVTIKSHFGEVSRKVRVHDAVERISPLGRYSMSPLLTADGEL